MDGPTRERAARKLAALTNKVGDPGEWIDYSALEIKPDDYCGDVLRARTFEFRRRMATVGRPVDRKEWRVTASTVNAYYSPVGNELVLPAGVLQPPLFDRGRPAAMNFGGIGAVVAHELTHGFDDQGRKFDADGRLAEWQPPQVGEKFERQTQCLEDLYGSFDVQPRIKVNGRLTLGENIADLGGVQVAFNAYKDYIGNRPASAPTVEGMTDDQLFFIAYAQTWCTLTRPQTERMLAAIDPHAPPRFRVNGPLANTPEFAAVFSCREGTPMRPKTKCLVW
jgi:endothelin-converting enzyme/putative endopeptidase